VDYVPENWEVARLAGFDIRIHPRANLVRSDQHSVYGILATGTHAELGPACMPMPKTCSVRHICPKPFAETRDGKCKPAMCYICPIMHPRAATNGYINRIVGPAREYGFPLWYIQCLETFRP
jgi:hypothetical protein